MWKAWRYDFNLTLLCVRERVSIIQRLVVIIFNTTSFLLKQRTTPGYA